MSVTKIPITREGYERLQQELKHLRAVERPAIIEAIAEARSHGDLSENAEYHSARERQGYIEGRIQDLESKLPRADVIDPASLQGNTVKFGATVTLFDEGTEEEVTYQLVGPDEASLEHGRLSISSPVARAVIAKTAGEVVEVRTPSGVKSYEILTIVYQ